MNNHQTRITTPNYSCSALLISIKTRRRQKNTQKPNMNTKIRFKPLNRNIQQQIQPY